MKRVYKIFPYISANKVQKSIKKREKLDQISKTIKFPIKINIIIPTRSRPGIGYKYLIQTFKSLSSFTSIGVDFHVYAFARTEEPPIKDKHFTFIKIKDHQIDETKKILRQTMDWLEMMSEWKKICNNNEIYLYLEDDFILCKYGMNHLISLYFWAIRHLDEWLSLRTSFGFNGIFMQCRDIESMIDVIENQLKEKEYPVDYAIAEWWSSYLERIPRVHYTFRYNLFEHIGFVSSVGNDEHYKRNPKCYDSNSHKFNYYLEKFDHHHCQNYLLSPCKNPKIQNELQYKGREVIESSPILRLTEREFLMEKLSIRVLKGRRENCKKICHKKKLKCKEELYPFINDCKLFQKRFNSCICTSEIWYGDHHFGPMVQKYSGDPVLWKLGMKIDKCVILDYPDWKCDHQSNLDVIKLCACQKK